MVNGECYCHRGTEGTEDYAAELLSGDFDWEKRFFPAEAGIHFLKQIVVGENTNNGGKSEMEKVIEKIKSS